MNRIRKQVVVFVAGLLAFLMLYGLIGNLDYQEIVIQEMGNETYMHIYQKLGGHGIKDSEIVKEYKSHQEYYDSLSCYSQFGEHY